MLLVGFNILVDRSQQGHFAQSAATQPHMQQAAIHCFLTPADHSQH